MQPPNRNLTPDAEFWGRWVEQQIGNLTNSQTALSQTTAMALAGINSSISKLSDQISAINTLQGQMATTISDLATTQATLATTVSDLATAQGQITTLLASQVNIPSVSFVQGTTYSIPTSPSAVARATASYTVPTGYTKALLWATANDQAVNSTALTGYLHAWLKFSGSGPFISSPAHTALMGTRATASVSGGYSYSGLSGGGTISVTSNPFVESSSWASSSDNYTNLLAFCLFYK